MLLPGVQESKGRGLPLAKCFLSQQFNMPEVSQGLGQGARKLRTGYSYKFSAGILLQVPSGRTQCWCHTLREEELATSFQRGDRKPREKSVQTLG